ncbi:MAG: hypothetical protein ABR600_01165 [Actinomycetota bacterium]
MAAPKLVTIDLRFTTAEDPEQMAERVREAVRMIAGREAMEHFRWRTESLEPPKDRIRPR